MRVEQPVHGARGVLEGVLRRDDGGGGPRSVSVGPAPGPGDPATADAEVAVLRQVLDEALLAGQTTVKGAATFEDGYRAACVVDAVLESHAAGNAWTKVGY